MPWTKLSKDEFINCLVGRLHGENDFEEQIHIKAESKITDRSKVIGGKILEETKDLVIFEKQDSKFRQSYNELMKLEYENKSKLDELDLKLKRISK